ncbi:MAG: hypothetical protein ACLTG0_08100 [Oscillibacter sp.]
MFQLSLFTEFGRLCNPFDYVLGFTFLLMAFHLLFLLFNLRERQRVKLFCLGSASAGPAAAYRGAAALVPVHQSHL